MDPPPTPPTPAAAVPLDNYNPPLDAALAAAAAAIAAESALRAECDLARPSWGGLASAYLRAAQSAKLATAADLTRAALADLAAAR